MTREQWKTIPEYPDYKVSNFGRVKKGEKQMTIHKDKNDGRYVCLWNREDKLGGSARLSRLVGAAFCPAFKPYLRAIHRDGDKGNCRYSNLRWVGVGKVSFVPRGDKQGCSKLTWEQVRAIRKSTSSRKELAESHSVSYHTICDILLKKTWVPTKSASRVGKNLIRL